jgi:hypothetical protein
LKWHDFIKLASKSICLSLIDTKKIMGFADKVLEYQQKKLAEAQNNLQSHLTRKEQLQGTGTEKEIANEEKMIKIWSNNIEKINHAIGKLQKK